LCRSCCCPEKCFIWSYIAVLFAVAVVTKSLVYYIIVSRYILRKVNLINRNWTISTIDRLRLLAWKTADVRYFTHNQCVSLQEKRSWLNILAVVNVWSADDLTQTPSPQVFRGNVTSIICRCWRRVTINHFVVIARKKKYYVSYIMVTIIFLRSDSRV